MQSYPTATFNPSTSAGLLSARRASWTPSMPIETSYSFRKNAVDIGLDLTDGLDRFDYNASDDGGNINRCLQIDMKSLVGDAVGNMSISPASRDVVLATRRGLYIIELDAPFEVPRFLPQGGTSNVADVQWNPHPSRAEYIVSTSSEKLFIWNLFLVGKTSIEYILHSKYPVDGPTRSVTDINWAPDPDLVVGIGIDSWLWAWDLREPRRPIFGFSAFNAGGTQVKWNPININILASSHASEVLIWDRRKGSLPLSRISAHTSKIYGIDWSHDRADEIVTCSLDKTVKTWVFQAAESSPGKQQPISIIFTKYPVWRARHLPFGKGLLTLPQRSSTQLEMWKDGEMLETFTGHSDVVKEFVWRKGQSGNQFQLITWSKDRTLRFWPVRQETMERMGHVMVPRTQSQIKLDDTISFRNPPEGTGCAPALSIPVGHRSILAEVQAPFRQQNLVMQPHQGSAMRSSLQDKCLPESTHDSSTISASLPFSVTDGWRTGTMSRGQNARKPKDMDVFTWLTSVKVGQKRESSESVQSGPNSVHDSPLASGLRLPTADTTNYSVTHFGRGASFNIGIDTTTHENSGSQTLQDEITSVLMKLSASKISLEKHDLIKKRTCTLGLHGPWGESSSVFIRITFTFPRDYPHSRHPHGGTPTVDLERNPLISLKDRALILRRLRRIREQRRPCLEACLRFLLFAPEDGDAELPFIGDSDSSSSDDLPSVSQRGRDPTIALLRNKNLAEPRTSQGVFGRNGELICFFRAPPRIVRNLLQDLTVFPSTTPRSSETLPRLFQSPVLLSDAVRRLHNAATDHVSRIFDSKRTNDGENILRIMTNLPTSSQHKSRRDIESKYSNNAPTGYTLIPSHSTVFINCTAGIAGADRRVAAEYIFKGESLEAVCRHNAIIASKYCRYDHLRIFESLGLFLRTSSPKKQWGSPSTTTSLRKFVNRLYAELCSGKDIQLLAMVSALVLQACSSTESTLSVPEVDKSSPAIMQKFNNLDDHGYGRGSQAITNQIRYSSMNSAAAASLSPKNSSRGSWSNLFNSGSVRQFMTGVQDTLKDSLSSSTEPPSGTASSFSSSLASSRKVVRGPSVSLMVDRRRTHATTGPIFPRGNDRHRRVLTCDICFESSQGIIDMPRRSQHLCHILVYAELLFGWGLLCQRSELLKSVSCDIHVLQKMKSIGGSQFDSTFCCEVALSPPHCSICRLAVKGLSYSCPQCQHVTHVACWHLLQDRYCPSGCNCICS